MPRPHDVFTISRGIAACTGDTCGEYLYVPGEVLIDERDEDRVRGPLTRLGGGTYPGIAYDNLPDIDYKRADLDLALMTTPGGRLDLEEQDPDQHPRARWRPSEADDQALTEIGLRRWYVPHDREVPRVVAMLRASVEGPPVSVAPNHVLSFEPFYHGGPGGAPWPPQEPPPQPPERPTDLRVRVAVLDTGIVKDWQSQQWFQGRIQARSPQDDEVTDQNTDGVLDPQAGHGTFIAGIIAAQAPNASIRALRVLSSYGVASDAQVAQALRQVSDHEVINLSLGGYTRDDLPPPAVARVLRELPLTTAVIAAAGNASCDRPFWPGASKRVIAVAAHDGGAPPTPAAFSNYGGWVDCCAFGVDVHAPFVEHNGPQSGTPDPDDFERHARWSGTSFAAPLVAGRVAAKVAANPGDARREAEALVRDPALPWTPDYGTVIS